LRDRYDCSLAVGAPRSAALATARRRLSAAPAGGSNAVGGPVAVMKVQQFSVAFELIRNLKPQISSLLPKARFVSRIRWWILVVGPFAILAASFALTQTLRSERRGPPASNHFLIGEAEAADSSERRAQDDNLAEACRQVAEQVAPRLGPECHTIVRPPFVLAGDLNEEGLDAWHRETIAPAMRAMSREMLDTPPSQPITVLLLATESSYNVYAEKLFGDRGVSIYGYYKPGLRTLVMNIGTGGGTLVHELTHALVDFDFPQIPDWFNEGLASLHEQCRFSEGPDGPTIEGLENWRLPGLQKAIRAGQLGSIESLLATDEFRGRREGLNYAQARYFCMYLERRGLLDDFYRLFRDTHAGDPRGSRALATVAPNFSWASLDQQFQQWVLTLEYRETDSTKPAE
jgi:hypothetical protein